MLNLDVLSNARRLLVEADVTPMQGQRFQPTGFPGLGAAVFTAKDGEYLLVESAQSMANRLEATIWDSAKNELIPELDGLSYVKVVDKKGEYLTSTITEAHRLNSPYILEGQDKTIIEKLKDGTKLNSELGEVSRSLLAKTLLKYDANSIIHGIFLSKKELAGGRFRLERALSSFIEASQVRVAASGGVKNDSVNPGGDTKSGFGNVPFSRDEYTAEKITAYFNLDLGLIRSYGLSKEAEKLLIVLSLYKIRALLDGDLRLRTACDFKVAALKVTSPESFTLPSLSDLKAELPALVKACANEMQGVTTVKYEKK